MRHRSIGMTKPPAAFTLTLAAFAFAPMSQGASAALPTARILSAEVAIQLAGATLSACRAKGYDVAVSVLDKTGDVRLFVASADTTPLSAELSQRKARSVVMFRTSSGAMEARARANPGFSAAMTAADPRLAFAQGALPIVAGGEFVGAVGVSGAPGGDKDEACAQAGLDHVANELR